MILSSGLELPNIADNIDSPGKLLEWIEALPIKQSEIWQYDPKIENFHLGVRFLISDTEMKNKAWANLVRYVVGVIYGRAAISSEIVWRFKPEFTVQPYRPFERADPDGPDVDPITLVRGWLKPEGEAIIKCYFRAIFRPVKEASLADLLNEGPLLIEAIARFQANAAAELYPPTGPVKVTRLIGPGARNR